MDQPQALIFDVFGTVVDWRTGVASEVHRIFAGKPLAVDSLAFADAWRAEYQPAMATIRGGNRGYVALEILHRENLERLLARFGLADALGDAEKAELNRAWERLPPWPDSVAGLSRLRQHYLIAACSNGSIALMSRLAKFAGLPWHAILGADIAKAYKPQRQVYLKSCEALGLAPQEVMMVAAHNGDLHAAADCGLQTAFIVRRSEHGPSQRSDLAATGDWQVVASDLENLAEKLMA